MRVRARLASVAILVAAAATAATAAAPEYSHFTINVAEAKSNPREAFAMWAVHNNKHYSPGTAEFENRLAAWTENFERAASTGAEAVTLNGLQDVSLSEFQSSFFGTKERPQTLETGKKRWIYEDVEEFPPSLDWREKGVIGPIKNQHANGTPCGCCWAFATIGVTECINAMVTGKVLSLSEQQLIDCDRGPPWYNLGCEGGDFGGGVEYIVKNRGIDLEDDYPYEGLDDKCQWKKEKDKYAAMDGMIDVPRTNYTALMQAVVKHPVATAVCCGPFLPYWHAYTGGIMDIEGHEEACYRPLDHAVTIVGYGEEDGKPYWLIKNSWGEKWGENGFFRVPRIESSAKGWAGSHTAPGFPIKKGLNPEVDAYLEASSVVEVS